MFHINCINITTNFVWGLKICIHVNGKVFLGGAVRNCMKIGLEYSFGYFALSKDTFGHTWTMQQV